MCFMPASAKLIREFRRLVGTQPIFRPFLSVIFGAQYANHHFLRKTFLPFWSIFLTGEVHNFTYDLTDTNLRYLAEIISIVTGEAPEKVEAYFREVAEDEELAEHIRASMKRANRGGARQSSAVFFGRRLGWYALVRATKPKTVIETGVERGHGSVLLCSALLRNHNEGHPGRYFGTDINPNAGWLLGGRYATVGKIIYGDSIESLRNLNETIDIFINDSDHSADYEYQEYVTVTPKLSSGAMILGDNAHVTDKLARYAREHGRKFLFFKESPKTHWYPGGGIGIAYWDREATHAR